MLTTHSDKFQMHSDIKRKFNLRIFWETLQRMEMKGERKPKSNRGKLTRENAVGKSNVEPKLKV